MKINKVTIKKRSFKNILSLLFFLQISFLAFPQRDQMANEMAYAIPLENINIDAKLDDWPKNIKKYPIKKLPYNDKIRGIEDINAYFQVGYSIDRNQLYFAVVIEDNSNIVDYNKNARWTTQDTYSLYIDEQHEINGSGVLRYTMSKYFQDFGDSHISWDPAVAELQKPSNICYKVENIKNKTIIEYSITIKRPLKPYTIIGVDHVVIDKDVQEAGYTFLSWINSNYKDSDPGKIGQLMILPEENKLLKISGILNWHNNKDAKLPTEIILQSKQDSNFWLLTKIDSTGSFNSLLPKGEYELKLKPRIYHKDDNFYEIKLESQTTFEVKDLNTEYTFWIKEDKVQLPKVSQPLFSSGLDLKAKAKLDTYIITYQKALNIPGVSLAIIDNGKVAFSKVYGVKNSYTQEPINLKTRFEAASITKPFFAFAVLRLMEKGIIDIDKPLYQYLPLPEDVAKDPRAKTITARIVLSHSTGFPNWPWLNASGKLDIKSTPGTKYTYSGAAYGYLQEVVESLTKKDIVAILKEEVLEVLDIENTYFEYHPFLLANTALGHNEKNEPHANDIRREAHVASSMITNASSLSKFFIGILERKGLKTSTYEQFFKMHTITNPDTTEEEGEKYFGLGLYFEKTPLGLSFGHSGSNSGFKCDAVIFEEKGKGFVLLTNGDNGSGLIYDLYDILFYGEKLK